MLLTVILNLIQDPVVVLFAFIWLAAGNSANESAKQILTE